MTLSDRVGHDWLRARDTIADALARMMPNLPPVWYQNNAAAIIARLALLDPPLILARPDEIGSPPTGTSDG